MKQQTQLHCNELSGRQLHVLVVCADGGDDDKNIEDSKKKKFFCW